MKTRTTPIEIKNLKENEIFVFGSNSQGKHAGGAAALAVKKFGAIMGQAHGLQGQSYAIDTMSGIDEMKKDIPFFIQMAKSSNKIFLVTEIGCGIAGHKPKDIAPLFKNAKDVENIHLPESFWKIINELPLLTFKGFKSDLKCRDFQYELEKEYEHTGKVEACAQGFHACENPFDVWKYYPPTDGNRFCETEQSGETKTHSDDSKVASSRIKIKAEIGFKGLIEAAVKFIFEKTIVVTPKLAGEATSGKYSNSATSGYNSHSATSGYNSHSATSGKYSNSATSGDNSHSVTSGKYSNSATSGKYSNSATSGDNSHSATSGDNSHSATSGKYSNSATSGDNSHSATSGYNSHSATSGYNSHSATSGKYSNSATSGYNSAAQCEDTAIAAAVGINSRAKGAIGCWIVVAEWKQVNNEWKILGVQTAIIDGEKVKADTWYILKDGKLTIVE